MQDKNAGNTLCISENFNIAEAEIRLLKSGSDYFVSATLTIITNKKNESMEFTQQYGIFITKYIEFIFAMC